MDVQHIEQLQPLLYEFLEHFREFFRRSASHCHLGQYVRGQMSDLERKNVEAMALEQEIAPRTLQEFLANYDWDHAGVRDKLQEIIVKEHAGPGTIGIIDETSFVKKGDKTPGTQRQHCGAVGKKENCIVTVHLAFARDSFHCLVDGELFLPEIWSDDRERCREAGIPETMVYRSKSDIALEMYRRAQANGLTFDWLTFDEWYASKPLFLRALVEAQQFYVGEVPKSFVVWFSRPRLTWRRYRRGGPGVSRSTPRVTAGSPKPHAVEWGRHWDLDLGRQAWEQWHLKETQKGPMVVEVKSKIVWPKEGRLPMAAHRLLIVRNVLHREELKYFLCYAGEEVPTVEQSLRIAYTRWPVERAFQDGKGRVGMDDYEGRRYPGLIRHLIISAVSLLFLARLRARFLVDFSEVTVRQMRLATNALVKSLSQPAAVAQQILAQASRIILYHQRRNAAARASHTRRRNAILQEMGIDMASIKRCCWDTS